jgi:DNA-binding transcriptional LysR family regulator
MNDRLTALRLFVRAALTGNFSTAGKELGLSQPSTSRLIATLEREIGVTLFNRTTRAVSLTEAGMIYLARVETIIASLDEADHEARGTGELRGVLRIGTSSNFGLRMVLPRMGLFVRKHPALKVDVISNDTHQDLISEGLDVALRFGASPVSTAIARKLMESPRILVAAPSYLLEYGTPLLRSDLAGHTLIAGPEHMATVLSQRKDECDRPIRIDSRITVNINEGAITAAMAGLGVTATSLQSVTDELKSRKLMRLFPEWDLGSVELHAVFVSGKTVKPAARAFAAFLYEELADLRLSSENADSHKMRETVSGNAIIAPDDRQ